MPATRNSSDATSTLPWQKENSNRKRKPCLYSKPELSMTRCLQHKRCREHCNCLLFDARQFKSGVYTGFDVQRRCILPSCSGGGRSRFASSSCNLHLCVLRKDLSFLSTPLDQFSFHLLSTMSISSQPGSTEKTIRKGDIAEVRCAFAYFKKKKNKKKRNQATKRTEFTGCIQLVNLAMLSKAPSVLYC